MLTERQVEHYHEQGYLVVRELFSAEEIAYYRKHFEQMRQQETVFDNLVGVDNLQGELDPLNVYPRLMHPHRRDKSSLEWLIDDRLNSVMTALLSAEPFAVQTMFYFKPPGARGQALHQDQYYLRVQPGTCMAAWMAVDDCDVANGCLRVVPGSHTWPLLCATEADTEISFTDVTVELPEGTEAVPVVMKAGDVLFFNGQIVHGSLPNTTKARFRRALIGHYIVGEAEQVGKHYHPVLRMNGDPLELGISEGGGTCGTWVDVDGTPQLEMIPESAA
jgi:phytanoyl-CoA hydroxylase